MSDPQKRQPTQSRCQQQLRLEAHAKRAPLLGFGGVLLMMVWCVAACAALRAPRSAFDTTLGFPGEGPGCCAYDQGIIRGTPVACHGCAAQCRRGMLAHLCQACGRARCLKCGEAQTECAAGGAPDTGPARQSQGRSVSTVETDFEDGRRATRLVAVATEARQILPIHPQPQQPQQQQQHHHRQQRDADTDADIDALTAEAIGDCAAEQQQQKQQQQEEDSQGWEHRPEWDEAPRTPPRPPQHDNEAPSTPPHLHQQRVHHNLDDSQMQAPMGDDAYAEDGSTELDALMAELFPDGGEQQHRRDLCTNLPRVEGLLDAEAMETDACEEVAPPLPLPPPPEPPPPAPPPARTCSQPGGPGPDEGDSQQMQSNGKTARRATDCPACSAHAQLVPQPGSAAWSKCGKEQCEEWIEHGRQGYRCRACQIYLCPKCAGRNVRRRGPPRAFQRDLDESPAQQNNEKPAVVVEAPKAAPAETTLLDILRKLPAVRRIQLVNWVPEQIAQRYAEMRISTIDWMLNAIDASLHPAIVEEAARLAHALPHLILRCRLHDKTESKKDPHDELNQRTNQLMVMRQRLRLAETADWKELAWQALQDEEQRYQDMNADNETPLRDAHEEQPWEMIAGAADEGDLRKAKRLLMQQKLLPPTEDTFEKICKLFPDIQEEQKAYQPQPPQGAHYFQPVKEKHIADFARGCRRAAHPGPSGERNAHIVTAMRAIRAKQVLTRWANAWASKALPIQARQIWLQMIGIGGDKGGGKARPIVFQECLFKLAAGAIAKSQDRLISERVGKRQYAAGPRPGTAAMIWETEADMAMLQEDVFFGLDMENAFGATRRSDAHEEARACSTPMAQLQWSMWYGDAQQKVWIQIGNDWKQTIMSDGVCQGGCSAKQDFTLAFARAQRTADERVNEALAGEGAQPRWGKRLYMDDECIRFERRHWKRALQAISEAMAEHGYKLRLDKTNAHCPAAKDDDELAQQLERELQGFATFCKDGLPLLGKQTDGEDDTIVSAAGTATGPTAKRMASAKQLAQRIEQLLDAEISGRKIGPAWKLITQVLNKALSYDICVSSPGSVEPYAVELDALVENLVRRCFDPGDSLPPAIWQATISRLREPRQQGGLDVAASAEVAPYAFLSAVVSVLPGAARQLAAVTGTDPLPQLQAAGMVSLAQQALTKVNEQGVNIDAWGMACDEPEKAAGGQLVVEQAIASGVNLVHRRRGWLAKRAEIILNQQAPTERAHRWTHGGEEGGLGFSASATMDMQPWDDTEFILNLRRRSRLPVCQQGAQCQHLRKRKAKCTNSDAAHVSPACGAPLDAMGDHPLQCLIGGEHTALHDAAADELAEMHRQAGLSATREVVVPQLATQKKTEPRADILAWGHVALPQVRLDFTVVSPWASRNSEAALLRPGETAARAERSKDAEYGARGGISILGIAMETGGRHGPRLRSHLQHLAALARQREGLHGKEPRHHLKHWRERLAVLMGRYTARTIEAASTPPPTRPEQQPQQASQHEPATCFATSAGNSNSAAPPAKADSHGTASHARSSKLCHSAAGSGKGPLRVAPTLRKR